MKAYARNVAILSVSQGLMMTAMTLAVATSALVGFALASDPSLATLPLAAQFLATMLTTVPASLLMARIGRKAGFMLATFFGMGGGALAGIAIIQGEFWLFVAASVLLGAFNGFGNYFRFAAADAVDANYKSRAIAYVMAGGVAAAILGPNLARWSKDLIEPAAFAGSYASLVAIYLLALVALAFLRLPHGSDTKGDAQPHMARTLGVIASQPKFLVALLCATLGYAVMTLVMTATPLAMHAHAHHFDDTSFVIQWHVLGMFAPSFVTGHLIRRFGVLPILLAGVAMELACVFINLSGTDTLHFWAALFLLGIGWNFLFVGGTTLLTETYLAEERAKVQALNDFTVFTTVTIASLSAGALQSQLGWQAVNLGVLPLLSVVLGSLVFLARQPGRTASPAPAPNPAAE